MHYIFMHYKSFVVTPNFIAAQTDPSIVRIAMFTARDKKDNRIIYDFTLYQDKSGFVEAARWSKIENGSYIRSMPQMFYCHDFFGCLSDFRKKTDPF